MAIPAQHAAGCGEFIAFRNELIPYACTKGGFEIESVMAGGCNPYRDAASSQIQYRWGWISDVASNCEWAATGNPNGVRNVNTLDVGNQVVRLRELAPDIYAEMEAAVAANAVPGIPPVPTASPYRAQPKRMVDAAPAPKARWPWYVGIGLSALTLVVVADNKGWF